MKRIIAAALAAGIALSASAADTPTYPGGREALDTYITTNLRYPAPALENGIEGIVQVKFVVNADGSIGTIRIARMIDPDLEQEAIRLVKNMPAWLPAENAGTPVKAEVTLPIKFSLPE